MIYERKLQQSSVLFCKIKYICRLNFRTILVKHHVKHHGHVFSKSTIIMIILTGLSKIEFPGVKYEKNDSLLRFLGTTKSMTPIFSYFYTQNMEFISSILTFSLSNNNSFALSLLLISFPIISINTICRFIFD
ncbi:hypothetical protein MXB_163 [Myxobolus squamalis]|nr:hypothetical protein MXB_163 [Myxobolus squamalis]